MISPLCLATLAVLRDLFHVLCRIRCAVYQHWMNAFTRGLAGFNVAVCLRAHDAANALRARTFFFFLRVVRHSAVGLHTRLPGFATYMHELRSSERI